MDCLFLVKGAIIKNINLKKEIVHDCTYERDTLGSAQSEIRNSFGFLVHNFELF